MGKKAASIAAPTATLAPALEQVEQIADNIRSGDAKMVETETAVILIIGKFEKPRPSSSGKSLVIASTLGNKSVGQTDDGNDIIAGINVYTRA